MRHTALMLCALAVCLTSIQSASATQVDTSLAFLLDNGFNMVAGDKMFDRWFVAGDTGRVNPADIRIVALNDGGLDPGPGLQFNVLNNALTVFDDDSISYTIGFRVTVLDPLLRVKDNSLNLTSYSVDADEEAAGVSITEWIGTTPGSNDLGTKHVEVVEDFFSGDSTILSDSATFKPLSEIWVTKNINVFAVDFDDFAALYGFQQRFSQEYATPEPVTAGLCVLGIAALGLVTARRRV